MLRRLAVPAIAVALLLPLLAPVAHAYINQPPVQIMLSGPGRVVRCGEPVTIRATVVGTATGNPVKSQIVSWDLVQTQSSADRLSARRTLTNARGRTSVTLTFGPVAGARLVSATVTIVSPTISVSCAGGLPQTSPRLPAGAQEAAPAIGAPSLSASAPSSAHRPIAAADPGSPVSSLRLERLGMDLPVVEGDGVTVPEGAAARFPGTAWPGAGSNTFLYGHARDDAFGPLWFVRRGDRLELDLADGTTALYEVTDIDPVVPWNDLSHLAPTDTERITLQTCLTYEPTAPRLVVIAERVNSGA